MRQLEQKSFEVFLNDDAADDDDDHHDEHSREPPAAQFDCGAVCCEPDTLSGSKYIRWLALAPSAPSKLN